MSTSTELFMGIRSLFRLYDKMLKKVCTEHNLTVIETDVISFLQNNPEKDTAADIVELRMLSKGNVSQAVESLIQRSLLRREQDAADRRRIHLFLTPAAEPIIQSMERLWARFEDEIFAGLSRDERAIFERVNDRISANTRQAMAGRIRK